MMLFTLHRHQHQYKYYKTRTWKICLLKTKYWFRAACAMDNDLFCIEVLLHLLLFQQQHFSIHI